MTSWTPPLDEGSSPKYVALADAIAQDIKNGVLRTGERLPTHRNLARKLGVTIGTITRAYAEVGRRGLVSGEVGRGTFVQPWREKVTRPLVEEATGIDLSFNAPVTGSDKSEIAEVLAELAADPSLSELLDYQPYAGRNRHRTVGAAWLSGDDFEVSPAETIITTGAQNGILLALGATCEPGDVVLCESLTFPGTKAAARFLRLRLEGVAIDDDGVCPEAFEEACRRHRPKAFYCTPTLQNPTATVMPTKRRERIAAVAEKYRVAVVEDDIYGRLVPDGPAPISSYLPESSFYLTSLSKCLAPGLRIGYMRAPSSWIEAILSAIMTTTVMPSPVGAEMATRLIEGGIADRVVEQCRQETEVRQTVARERLGDRLPASVSAASSHVWLPLPLPWRGDDMARQAAARGVQVASADLFTVGRDAAPHAVRISLGAVPDAETLERGLDVVTDLLTRSPTACYRVI